MCLARWSIDTPTHLIVSVYYPSLLVARWLFAFHHFNVSDLAYTAFGTASHPQLRPAPSNALLHQTAVHLHWYHGSRQAASCGTLVDRDIYVLPAICHGLMRAAFSRYCFQDDGDTLTSRRHKRLGRPFTQRRAPTHKFAPATWRWHRREKLRCILITHFRKHQRCPLYGNCLLATLLLISFSHLRSPA